MFILCFVIFFFKQKTAYEMRISDWSSDVCSSDLHQDQRERDGRVRCPAQHRGVIAERQAEHRDDEPGDEQDVAERGQALLNPVARAMLRRAEPAHAAETRSITH